MTTISPNETPRIDVPGFVEQAFQRLYNQLRAGVEEWNVAFGRLQQFEESELLDNPDEAKLKAHQHSLKMLISMGELIFNVTQSPAFPDREMHRMVEATLQILRDDMATWHGNTLTPEKSAQILASFPQ